MRLKLLFALLSLSYLAAACSSATPEPTPSQLITPPADASASPTPVTGDDVDNRSADRQRMVQVVRDWGLENEAVLEALGQVPRHAFVPVGYESQAYANHPLPIGFGQTISQPYIVGLMTDQLGVGAGAKVLEIGTGSGYQAAILAELGMEVYSIEIIGALAERAREDLQAVGYDNVELRHADGYFGWEEQAPFDGILVTAAPDHVPQPLVRQLAIGATMVIPVGPAGGYQELWKITRISEEEVKTVSLGGVRFVPLTRQE